MKHLVYLPQCTSKAHCVDYSIPQCSALSLTFRVQCDLKEPEAMNHVLCRWKSYNLGICQIALIYNCVLLL